jgi:hypothetical protein
LKCKCNDEERGLYEYKDATLDLSKFYIYI